MFHVLSPLTFSLDEFPPKKTVVKSSLKSISLVVQLTNHIFQKIQCCNKMETRLYFMYLMLILIPAAILLGLILRGYWIKAKIRQFLGWSKAKLTKIVDEFRRKSFHLVGVLIPVIYYLGLHFGFLSRAQTTGIIGFLTVWILTVEFLRYTSDTFKEFLLKHISGIMRSHEHKKLFGSTWYLIGCFWTLYLFPPIISMTSILFLNLGDLAAAIVGMSYGETKLLMVSNIFGLPPSKKSLEGSFACFVTCFLVGCGVFHGVFLFEYIVFFGAVAATLAELIPGIDDNVTIPLLSAFSMQVAMMRLGVEAPHLG